MKRYGLFYLRGHDGEMEENEGGEWVKYEDAAERVAALEQNYAVLRSHYHAAAELHAAAMVEVTRERDTALAALGELQAAAAAAAELMAAADALLKEPDHHRAVCVLADALRNKGRGS